MLGPNGAGKTTTTEILEGYRDRTRARYRVSALIPASDPRWRERIGLVLQESGLNPLLTVGETLQLYAPSFPHRCA